MIDIKCNLSFPVSLCSDFEQQEKITFVDVKKELINFGKTFEDSDNVTKLPVHKIYYH